jgi:peptide/nickel transport system permease protein
MGMGGYVVRRLVWAVVVLLAVTFLTFLVYFELPHVDPTQTFTHGVRTASASARTAQIFGLDQPFYERFLAFAENFFLGDEYGWPGLGTSFHTRGAIRPLITSRALVTIQLALGAVLIWLAIGVPLGIISAVRSRSLVDRMGMAASLLAISTPVFFLAMAALYVFWFRLGVAPGTGYVSPVDGFGAWFGHMIMPWTVLALLFAAFYARMTRANMLEVMSEDFVRTARAKGLSERRLLVRHGLRATMAPLVIMVGMDLGQLFGGVIIIESVFNLPGLGQYALQAVRHADLYVLADVTLLLALSVAIFNLLADLVHAFLDPRVRYRTA